jgi:hypothetical protein
LLAGTQVGGDPYGLIGNLIQLVRLDTPAPKKTDEANYQVAIQHMVQGGLLNTLKHPTIPQKPIQL